MGKSNVKREKAEQGNYYVLRTRLVWYQLFNW